jgi:uncharacterized protein YbjT (DUF2867 family)
MNLAYAFTRQAVLSRVIVESKHSRRSTVPIVITTPTGNVGRHVVTQLLAAGESLRLIARYPDRLDAAIAAQTEVIQGSIDDPKVLSQALNGAESLFWCIPQSHTQDDVLAYYRNFTQALCEAINQTELPPRIVAVSSGGKGRAQNAGAISALHAMEEMLDSTGANIKYLRCGNFMENFLWQVKPIAQQGRFFYPLPADMTMPMVCTKDISMSAVKWLLDRRWSGQSGVAVQGAEDLSLDRVAEILSEVLDQPIRFQPVSAEVYYQSMLKNGCSPAFSASLVDLFAEVANGLYDAESRTVETTTTTTFKQWAQTVFQPIVNANA